MKIVKYFLKTIVILLIIVVGYFNIKLYDTADFVGPKDSTYNQNVQNQLNFLKKVRDKGEATKMQEFFPEGFMFFQSLYGLTWCELIENQSPTSDLFQAGMKEIEGTLQAVFSEEGKRPFLKELPIEYGTFYRGWSNYLLAQKLILLPDSLGIERYKNNCKAIVEAMNQSKSPYLESYLGNVWPADMMVAMASIEKYDQIVDTTYQKVVADWLDKVKSHLDLKTGLIPHSATTEGETLESARGSSQSLMLYFLKDMDSTFADQQFAIYNELFLESRFGLQAIREYPKGMTINGDIDSGPIIWGIGPSATIVGQKTYGQFGEWSHYQEIKNCLQAIGFSYQTGKEKKYLLGQFPMADVFLAWSNVSEPKDLGKKVKNNWRWKFQLISLFFVLVFLFLLRSL